VSEHHHKYWYLVQFGGVWTPHLFKLVPVLLVEEQASSQDTQVKNECERQGIDQPDKNVNYIAPVLKRREPIQLSESV